MDYSRKDNESLFEWKVRLCNAKLNKELKMDWSAIVELLGLECSADNLRHSAYAYKEFQDNMLTNNKVATRILSISDLHIPFQLDYHLLEDYRNVDILQINGDISDNQAISKFGKTYRISPMEEIIKTREYLIDLINYIKPRKVVMTYGNHDLRFQNYLAKNLDSDILELQPNTSIELLVNDGFTWYNKRELTKTQYPPLKNVLSCEIIYDNNWHCQIGDTIFCHPKAFKSGMMKTAEQAMLFFRNEGYIFKTLIMAHTHRSGQYSIGNTTIFEQGCFCDTKKNNYNDGMLYNSQKEGFMYIGQDIDGNTVDSKLIVLN